MDHEEAVRQNTTERYMLDELDSDQRDQFEEHYFDCQDCAKDVRAAAMLIEHIKEIERERRENGAEDVPAPNPISKDKPMGLLAWLRQAFPLPAFAASATALATVLLLVVGYQNLVELPQLRRPHVLPAISLNLQTYGDNSEPVVVASGQAFLVNLIVSPGDRYSSYQVDLLNPKGKIDSSLPIRVVSSASTWPVLIPGANRESGTYKLVVQGRTAEGKTEDAGSSLFELQIQK